jgi:hypothetical protein
MLDTVNTEKGIPFLDFYPKDAVVLPAWSLHIELGSATTWGCPVATEVLCSDGDRVSTGETTAAGATVAVGIIGGLTAVAALLLVAAAAAAAAAISMIAWACQCQIGVLAYIF